MVFLEMNLSHLFALFLCWLAKLKLVSNPGLSRQYVVMTRKNSSAGGAAVIEMEDSQE